MCNDTIEGEVGKMRMDLSVNPRWAAPEVLAYGKYSVSSDGLRFPPFRSSTFLFILFFLNLFFFSFDVSCFSFITCHSVRLGVDSVGVEISHFAV